MAVLSGAIGPNRRLFWYTLILGSLAAFWLFQDTGKAALGQVGVLEGDKTASAVHLQVPGVIQAARTVPLSIDTAGRLTKIFLPAGTNVQAGQILATLDWAREETAYRATQALLEKMNAGFKSPEGQAATPEVLRELQRKIAELEIQQKAIAAKIAEKTLVAPFAGVVGTWMAAEASYVRPESPLVVLRDQSRWVVQYALPEQYRSQIGLGQRLTVQMLGSAKLEAEVTAIAPEIDPKTQAFAVTATLLESNAEWVPGMHAEVAQNLQSKSEG